MCKPFKKLLSGEIILRIDDKHKGKQIMQHKRKHMIGNNSITIVALNTTIGWSVGDDTRVLVAMGLSVGVYQINQIRSDMNYLGVQIDGFVTAVLDLLDAYDTIQVKLSALNNDSNGKVLIKADVLEWEAQNPGTTYSPERELQRIAALLMQYFASSPLLGNTGTINGTMLYRS